MLLLHLLEVKNVGVKDEHELYRILYNVITFWSYLC